ncbi:MAG: outer membrane lipoprotein-sorting protein [Sandaracinus sp.]|nr:outer membrane lipoprotein-sorting protein [Sandaracinus sp.]MCB9619389.1 outer membrane lipoprotein-sorting protein [Sandaracinus sp.]MCB9621904.1 outer membrane lipoprotein-sorting protein [Sandaracinus sp.]
MKRLLLSSCFVCLLVASVGAQRPRDARAILEAVHARDEGDHARLRVRMTLRDGRGATRTRDLSILALREDDALLTLVRFESPSDVAGTTLLTRDHDDARADEQWLHLPAFRRTSRIVANGRARSFLGSDLSFADLTRRHPDDFEARLLGEEDVEGERTWRLALTPRDAAVRDELGYRSAEIWVSQRAHVVVRSKAELLDGRTKYVQSDALVRVDGVWIARRLVARTVRGTTLESETVLERREVRFGDASVVADLFEPSQLGG